MKIIILAVLILSALFAMTLFHRPLSNLYNTTIDRGYFIPEGSSVFTFKPLRMNAGSGDWWIWGEDDSSYYVLTDAGYYTIGKTPSDMVDLQDRSTWGDAVQFVPLEIH